MSRISGFSWRGLIPQLFALFSVPLMALVLLLAFGGLYMHRMAMRSLVAERDARSARAAAALIGEQISHRRSLLLTLAQEVSGDPSYNQLQETLKRATPLQPAFDQGLAFFSPQGDLLAASGDRAFWEELTRTGGLRQIDLPGGEDAFLPMAVNASPGESPVILLAAQASRGNLLAAGAISPTMLFEPALEEVLSPGAGGLAFVTDASGDLLYQSGEFMAGEEPAIHPGVLEARRGESGADFFQAEGEEHAYAYSPVEAAGWALVFEEPWEAVASPRLRMTENAPLVLIPALLLAMFALWYGARWVVQPLQKLESQASDLGWGNYAAIEKPVGGIAEIHRLQNELIDLAHKVRAAQEGLRGYIGAMTEGQEEERRRLARELHDDTLQALIALNQRVQLAQLDVNGGPASAGLSRSLAEIQSLTDQTIQNLRRFTQALRPIYLEELGLSAALEMLARENTQPAGLAIQFRRAGPEQRLPEAAELALYRIAQEALSNVIRHARASQAELIIDYQPGRVTLVMQDNGIGFSVPESPAEFAPSGHFGFLGMHERAEAIGARLEISSRPGQGTRVAVKLETAPGSEDNLELTSRQVE